MLEQVVVVISSAQLIDMLGECPNKVSVNLVKLFSKLLIISADVLKFEGFQASKFNAINNFGNECVKDTNFNFVSPFFFLIKSMHLDIFQKRIKNNFNFAKLVTNIRYFNLFCKTYVEQSFARNWN